MPLTIPCESSAPRMICCPRIAFAFVESDRATAAVVQERLQFPLPLAAAACNYLHFGYSIRPFLIGAELAKAEAQLKPLTISSGLFRSQAQHVGTSFVGFVARGPLLAEAAPYFGKPKPFAPVSDSGPLALRRHPDAWFLTAARHRIRDFISATGSTSWSLRTLELDTSQIPLPAGMYFVPSGITMRPAPLPSPALTTQVPSPPQGVSVERLRNDDARAMATLLQAQLAYLGRPVPRGLIEAISREQGRARSRARARDAGAEPSTENIPAWFDELQCWELACRTLAECEDKLGPGWQVAYQFTVPASLLKWLEPEDASPPAHPVGPRAKSAMPQREEKRLREAAAAQHAARKERARLLAYEKAQQRARAMGHPNLAGSKSDWGPGLRSGLVKVEYTGAMEMNKRRH
jgi:hypothetical protein